MSIYEGVLFAQSRHSGRNKKSSRNDELPESNNSARATQINGETGTDHVFPISPFVNRGLALVFSHVEDFNRGLSLVTLYILHRITFQQLPALGS